MDSGDKSYLIFIGIICLTFIVLILGIAYQDYKVKELGFTEEEPQTNQLVWSNESPEFYFYYSEFKFGEPINLTIDINNCKEITCECAKQKIACALLCYQCEEDK